MSTEATSNSVPRHIGIIVDGNRRWAKRQGGLAYNGHSAGYENFRTIVRGVFERGIQHLTLYVFSTENWKREATEVKFIMNLALKAFAKELDSMHAEGIKITFLGTKTGLSPKLIDEINAAEQLTAQNSRGHLNLCFNYGGQEEITEAVKRIVAEGIVVENITPEVVKRHLYTAEIPPPDMIVRTSGEKRLSNFLLWDSAYAELMFVDELWPDFNEASLDRVLAEYAARQRRFGA